MSLLDIRDLRVSFGEATSHPAVDGVSLTVEKGEVLGLVGESGCGKSSAMLGVMGLLPASAHTSGTVIYNERDLMGLSDGKLSEMRGRELAMIFQDPMTSLNPVYRVMDQIAEQLRRHQQLDRRDAGLRAIELLEAVGIEDAASRGRSYPHEFSGGMRQRVMIAMAVSCDPRVLIADEPTTALDVTVQAQILALMRRLQREMQMAMLLVTHDMGVVAQIADTVAVMYAGRIVEIGPVLEVFRSPQHPYTQALLACVPRLDTPRQTRFAAIRGHPASSEGWSGCAFAPRCAYRMKRCDDETPKLAVRTGAAKHLDACHLEAGAHERRRVADQRERA